MGKDCVFLLVCSYLEVVRFECMALTIDFCLPHIRVCCYQRRSRDFDTSYNRTTGK
jgi:hypothetical protein